MNNTEALILVICISTIFPIILGMIWSKLTDENYTFLGCWFAGIVIEMTGFALSGVIWGVFELLKLI